MTSAIQRDSIRSTCRAGDGDLFRETLLRELRQRFDSEEFALPTSTASSSALSHSKSSTCTNPTLPTEPNHVQHHPSRRLPYPSVRRRQTASSRDHLERPIHLEFSDDGRRRIEAGHGRGECSSRSHRA